MNKPILGDFPSHCTATCAPGGKNVRWELEGKKEGRKMEGKMIED